MQSIAEQGSRNNHLLPCSGRVSRATFDGGELHADCTSSKITLLKYNLCDLGMNGYFEVWSGQDICGQVGRFGGHSFASLVHICHCMSVEMQLKPTSATVLRVGTYLSVDGDKHLETSNKV